MFLTNYGKSVSQSIGEEIFFSFFLSINRKDRKGRKGITKSYADYAD